MLVVSAGISSKGIDKDKYIDKIQANNNLKWYNHRINKIMLDNRYNYHNHL